MHGWFGDCQTSTTLKPQHRDSPSTNLKHLNNLNNLDIATSKTSLLQIATIKNLDNLDNLNTMNENNLCPRTTDSPINPYDELNKILRPWLGDTSCYGFGNDSADIFCGIHSIKGRGFTRLSLRNKPANPDWILEHWRTYTDTECPRCHHRIMALLKSHKISDHTYAAAPSIFCDCVRLEPSRLSSLSFFTDNWRIALDALDFAVSFAKKLKAERDSERVALVG
jgi:hypothetical protein